METIKKITGVAFITTSEGKRINFNHSVMTSEGDIVEGNIHKSFICLDEEVLGHIKAIEEYIYKTKLA